MIELRGAGTDSDNGYMEINRSTLELPTGRHMYICTYNYTQLQIELSWVLIAF